MEKGEGVLNAEGLGDLHVIYSIYTMHWFAVPSHVKLDGEIRSFLLLNVKLQKFVVTQYYL